MTKEYILSKVKDLIDKKVEDKTSPYHCSFIELYHAIEKDLKKELNALYKENAIEVGETLNSKYIKIKGDNNE